MELAISLRYGFDTSLGYVTLKIAGTEDETDQRVIRFQELTAGTAGSLCEEMPDRCRIALVQEILYLLQRAEISPDDQILISSEKFEISVLRRDQNDKSLLKRLSPTFRSILQMELQDDKNIADDFCHRANDGKFKDRNKPYIQMALDHPIFWTSAQKIAYFKQCREIEKSNPNSSLKIVSEENGNFSLDETENDGVNWIELLELDEDYIDTLFFPPGSSSHIDPGKIMSLADEKNEDGSPKYKYWLWKDFLRFFRNSHAHFWEDEMTQQCFDNNEEDGYWNFFSWKFPGLLLSVHARYKLDMSSKGIADPKFYHDR